MEKIKIVIVAVISLFITTILIKVCFMGGENISFPDLALKIIISQGRNNELIVKNLSVEEIYPADYQLNLQTNYYRIEILDKNKKILFTGKMMNKAIIFSDSFSGNKMTGSQIVRSLDELELYLPYYRSAEKVVFWDEKDNLKLEINLKDYSLPEIKVKTHLCGNGVCDFNENVLSCYTDCKFYLERVLKQFKKT